MSRLVAQARARVQRPGIRKLIKYSMVSVIAVAITVVLQFLCLELLSMPGWMSAFTASSIAAIPSYFLNRMWVWRKGGRSHFYKEVLPFWIMVIIGLGASMGASHLAEAFARNATNHGTTQSLIIVSASFLAFGILWIGKFLIFNKILFAHRPNDLDPALDGRAGLPT